MNPKDKIEKNKNTRQKNIYTTKGKEANTSNEKKNDELEKIIVELKQKLKDVEDKLLRSLAENDNLRKRHEKETEDNLKYATKNFASSLLPVTDNFQRAMQSVQNEKIEENKVLKNLVIGIQAIEKELGDALEKNGIKKFESLDQKFNPELHQAVSKIHSEKPDGLVVEELQKGFMIGDRLLRAAMVVVSMGPEKNK
ncbi:MAG: nucleotide exchange factor GrpE [Alphaproteobacteria bacterium]|nr:nucleotide exchange factor GrpE [Alphaproteobacteria bacterium]